MKWSAFFIALCLATGLLLISADADARHGGNRGGGFRGGWYGGRPGYVRGGPRWRSNVGFYFGPSWGWGGGWGGGWGWRGGWGGPFGWPYSRGFGYDPFFYPYPSTVIQIPATPPVYIEQPRAGAAGASTEYWDYCASPEGYSPYVTDCPGGWQKIASIPPGQEPGYWYECKAPQGFYPYVRNCPQGWFRVLPQQSSAGSMGR